MKTKVRQTAKNQQKNADLRETATNEILTAETIIEKENKLDLQNNEKKENEEKIESENTKLRKLCSSYFDSEKNAILFELAKKSISRTIVDFYGEKYGKTFAENLLENAAKYTGNFRRAIVDKIDGEMKKSDEKMEISGKTYFSVNVDVPTTSTAVCVIFNSFLTFAISAKLPCVSDIIRERETEKTTDKVTKLTEKIGLDNLAAILANNPDLVAKILAQQTK